MSHYTIRLASGEMDLPYVGHVTTTPRLVWLPDGAAEVLRARGALIDNPAEPAADEAAPATAPAPGPVKPRKGR